MPAYRSFLFAPGNHARKVTKVFGCGADHVILDLEDAVAKAEKVAKPKRERAPRESREGWGTFALKMPIAERQSYHEACGSAGASRFARIILNAFSNDDVPGFEAAICEAKKLR
jgi:hypothetical protein